jgi:hypothetical protein
MKYFASMNLSFAVVTATLVLGGPASADFSGCKAIHLTAPEKVVKSLESDPFLRPSLDTNLARKRALETMKTKDPEKFAVLRSRDDLSALDRSYLDEIEYNAIQKNLPRRARVSSGFTKNGRGQGTINLNSTLDTAKRIAKKEVADYVDQNWDEIAKTIFNDEDVPSRLEARQFTARKINEYLVYDAAQSMKRGTYYFQFDGYGAVEIDKKSLASGKVCLEIGTRNRGNKVPDWVMKLKTDKDAGSSADLLDEGA